MSKSSPDKGGRLAHAYRAPRTLEQLGRIAAAATFLGGALLAGIAIPVDISAKQLDNRVAYVKAETFKDRQYEQERKDDPLVVTVAGTTTTTGVDPRALQNKADKTHDIANNVGVGSGIMTGLGLVIGTLSVAIGWRRRRASSAAANAQMRKSLAAQSAVHRKLNYVAVGRVPREDVPLPSEQRIQNHAELLRLHTLDTRYGTELVSAKLEMARAREDLSYAHEALGKPKAALLAEEKQARAEAKADQARRETASILALYPSRALAECYAEIGAIRAECFTDNVAPELTWQDADPPARGISETSQAADWSTADTALLALVTPPLEEPTQRLPVLAAA